MAVRRGLNGTSLWDLRAGREIGNRRGYVASSRRNRPEKGVGVLLSYGFPLTVAFSPKDNLVAFAGPGGVRIWDVASGRESRWALRRDPSRRCSRSLEIDDSWEFHVAFSPDGKLVAAEDDRKGLCLWSMVTGQPYRRFPQLEIGHGIVFTPDGKRLISGGRHFHHWDIARGHEIPHLPGPTRYRRSPSAPAARPWPRRMAGRFDSGRRPRAGRSASSAGIKPTCMRSRSRRTARRSPRWTVAP